MMNKLNKLNLNTHGEERLQKIKVNHGKTEYFRRQRFCAEHGWIDLFLFPNFDAQHNACAPKSKNNHGAFLELPETLKFFKQAA